MSSHLPFRQIHLDFHTGPAIPDVGARFAAREFAHTMRQAHVDSVNLFAKCHHGHLYYHTARAERHPGLPASCDLLDEQIAALHAEGIKAPIYISVLCDEYAANRHPDWVARTPDGAPVSCPWSQPPYHAPLDAQWSQWYVLDLDSPYQDYLAEQTAEILARFAPVDGIWFDMCWDQPSSSTWAIAAMLRAGLDPAAEEDRRAHARRTARAFLARFSAQVRAARPDAWLFFNIRPQEALPDEIGYMGQYEIESLPTGGWGYAHLQQTVRYVRTLGKPYLGMTARFHTSWADFGGLKPYPALEYETSLMIAHGAACCVGDQLHPRGTLDPEAYRRIGAAYARVEAREPWLAGAKAETDIAVLHRPEGQNTACASSLRGAVSLLTQLGQQFDILPWHGDFHGYRLVVLADDLPVDADLAGRLTTFLAAGGRVLSTGSSGIDAAQLTAHAGMGVTVDGPSPFSNVYLQAGAALLPFLPDTEHIIYERSWRLCPGLDTETLATAVEPYFERTWQHFSSHRQTPPATPTDWPLATLHGGWAHVAFPLFDGYARQAPPPYRELVRAVLARLLPNPLVRLANAPTTAEVTVTRQADRRIVHVLHYVPVRRGDSIDLIEDIIPLSNVAVSLRTDAPVARVYLAPDGKELPFEVTNGRVETCIPLLAGHAMVVVE